MNRTPSGVSARRVADSRRRRQRAIRSTICPPSNEHAAPVAIDAPNTTVELAVAQVVRRRLEEVEPHAKELGSNSELEGIREILRRGNGSDRQLRVYNANRDIVEVVREIANATEAGGTAAS